MSPTKTRDLAIFGDTMTSATRDDEDKEGIPMLLAAEPVPEQRSTGLLSAMLGVTLGLLLGILGTYLAMPHPPRDALGPERYLQGYQHGDGHLVWTSYSPLIQEQLRNRGQDEQTTVQFYDWLRSRPGKIERVTYLGGYTGADGGTYLYLITGNRDDGSSFANTWTFITDRDGLIRLVQ